MKAGRNGICVSYTAFPQCRGLQDWVFIPREKILQAKEIIKSEHPYHLEDPVLKDGTEKYNLSGVLVETNEQSVPDSKNGWGIRLRCEATRKNKLEETLKHLKLFDKK